MSRSGTPSSSTPPSPSSIPRSSRWCWCDAATWRSLSRGNRRPSNRPQGPAARTRPAPRHLPMHFTLYSRSYCHLCQDMLDALQLLQTPERPFTVTVVDVDADAALVARFDELVPVLYAALEQPELCHYFLDAARVRLALDAESS